MLVSPMLDTAMLAMLDMVPTPMPTERGLLMPSPRLMPTMELMVLDMDMLVLAMAMVPMVLAMLDTLLLMSTERGLLMRSPRLMPTMELMAMVLAMLDMDIPVPTAMPTVSTASKMSSQPQIRVAHQVQTEAQKQTKSRSNLTFSAMNFFVI